MLVQIVLCPLFAGFLGPSLTIVAAKSLIVPALLAELGVTLIALLDFLDLHPADLADRHAIPAASMEFMCIEN